MTDDDFPDIGLRRENAIPYEDTPEFYAEMEAAEVVFAFVDGDDSKASTATVVKGQNILRDILATSKDRKVSSLLVRAPDHECIEALMQTYDKPH